MAVYNSNGYGIEADGPNPNSHTSIQWIHDNLAVNGDTITVPTGQFHWSAAANLSKRVTVSGNTTVTVGNGHREFVDNSQLIDDITGKRYFNLNAPGGQRLTGLSFLPGTGNTGGALVQIQGTLPTRIDHCHMRSYIGSGSRSPYVFVLDYNYGVIDHCVLDDFNTSGGTVHIHPGNPNGNGDHGDYAWSQPAGFGGPEFFFLENNAIGNPGQTNTGGGSDITAGGKVCWRYNEFWGPASGGNHGAGQTYPKARGGRANETYENTRHRTTIVALDAGAGGPLMYHNEHMLDNPCTGSPFANYRRYTSFDPYFYGASGLNAWDYNATDAGGGHTDGQPGFVFDSADGIKTGNLTSANAGQVVTDLNKNWVPNNKWVGYSFSPVDPTGNTSVITASTNNQLTLASWPGPNAYPSAMAYVIGKPLRLLDGPCNGPNALAFQRDASRNPINPRWLNFGREPSYSWGNTFNGAASSIPISAGDASVGIIFAGLDYFNDVGAPPAGTAGMYTNPYTPYAYPHPLVGGAVPTKIISLSGSGLAFGSVVIGSASPTAILTVANQGDTVLTVTSVTYPNAVFTGRTTGFTVAPGSSFDIAVTFTPLLVQAYSGNITVASDATAGTGTIAVSGTGMTPTPPIHGHRKQASETFGF